MKHLKKNAFWYIITLVLLIVIITTLIDENKVEPYTFESGFQEIKALDEKYQTDFKQEELNKTLINFKNIDPYIEDLTVFRTQLEDSIKGNPNQEEQALLKLTEIRVLMLLSQKNFILGKIVGNKGLVTDEGFSCAESGHIINLAYYYNLSHGAGILAYRELDNLLINYKDTANVRALVGIDEERPRFYFSPFGDIRQQVDNNLHVLENVCFLDMSGGLRSPVNPEDYENLEFDPDRLLESLEEQNLNTTSITA